MFPLFVVTIAAVLLSFIMDRRKTIAGLQKGAKMFLNLLPAFLMVLILVAVFLYFVPKETLVKYLGKGSGISGMVIAAVLGSIALIPGFIAYPLGAILIKSGVSYGVVSVFITTLMMVGLLTLPIEIKYFGVRVSLMRNGLSFVAAIIIGIVMGMFL